MRSSTRLWLAKLFLWLARLIGATAILLLVLWALSIS